MKFLGLISIVLIWGGLLFLLYKWPGKPSMSFSLHAAQTKAAQIYYCFLFLVSLPLFYIFIVGWYVPTFQLNGWFITLTTVGVIGQLIAVAVPALPGRKTTIHNIAAYTMAATFIPLTLLVATTESFTEYARVIAIAAALYMLGTLISYMYVKHLREKYLYFQAGYIAAFHVVIVVSAYL